MRMTLAVVFVSVVAGCAVDTTDLGVATNDVRIDPAKDDVEPAYVNGTLCKLVFKGALTPETQMYLIWAVGTRGIVDTAYNTPRRPNLYAIFGTGRPARETHHVEGQDAFDHYHIAENPGDGTDVDNTIWDLLVLFPGPNFPTSDPTRYRTAKTVRQMQAQISAGLLTPIMTLPEAGFPEVVLRIPVVCPDRDLTAPSTTF